MIDLFWQFARKRLELMQTGVTDDATLQRHRFTNCYRACDRVSQYLIRHPIQGDPDVLLSGEDRLFRVLLFRIFNRIDTWDYLQSKFVGPIRWNTVDQGVLENWLNVRSLTHPVFTGVYRITSKDCYGGYTKHANYARCIQYIMEHRSRAILGAKSLEEVFDILMDVPLLGPFMSMQLATDLGYTDMFPWTENDFIFPGPGCKRGVSKTFGVGFGDVDGIIGAVHRVCEEQHQHFPGLELPSRSEDEDRMIRPLSLMDIQNLFCEFDKYLRVVHPDVQVVDFGLRRVAKRPKQQYTPARDDDGHPRPRLVWPESYVFPRSWYG